MCVDGVIVIFEGIGIVEYNQDVEIILISQLWDMVGNFLSKDYIFDMCFDDLFLLNDNCDSFCVFLVVVVFFGYFCVLIDVWLIGERL